MHLLTFYMQLQQQVRDGITLRQGIQIMTLECTSAVKEPFYEFSSEDATRILRITESGVA